MNELHLFLANPANSVTREKLIYNRFYFDLKIAAARAGYALTMYEPDVDRDGFDVVIDDGETTRFVQLKTVLKHSATSKWHVRRKLMRLNEPEDLGCLDPNLGRGGAVVLIEIDSSQIDPTFSYYVTDSWILDMLGSLFGESDRDKGRCRILQNRRILARRCSLDIHSGDRSGKAALQKSVFLKAKNPDCLLALLGLYSSVDFYGPNNAFDSLRRNGFRVNENGDVSSSDSVVKNMGRSFVRELLDVLDEAKLLPHPWFLDQAV